MNREFFFFETQLRKPAPEWLKETPAPGDWIVYGGNAYGVHLREYDMERKTVVVWLEKCENIKC
jgi:hypothetical protein